MMQGKPTAPAMSRGQSSSDESVRPPKVTHGPPQLSKRSLAKAQGQADADLPPVKGVQHRTSRPKQLREKAQLTGKRMMTAFQKYWITAEASRGFPTDRTKKLFDDYIWWHADWVRDWDEAEAASWEAGNTFLDRWGVRQNEASADNSRTGRILAMWQKALAKSEVPAWDILRTPLPRPPP